MAETLDKPETKTTGSDDNLIAHYARKNDIMKAHVHGVAIRALCGVKWVPTRDGSKYPVCKDCEEIYKGVPD